MEKCCVCEQEKDESQGRKYTPREIVGNFLVEPGTAKDKALQIRLAGIASFAASIIKFHNPPGGADQPMNWICAACQSRFFSKATAGPQYAKGGRLRVYDFETGISSLQPKSGCFVATACCGTAECPEVAELSRFRDNVLLPTSLGRRIVALYYRLSPPITELMARSSVAWAIVKYALVRPAYKLARKM